MINLLVSLLLVGINAAATAQVAAPGGVNATYLVGPTDVLAIKVVEETLLTGDYTVDSDGSITFPLIGRVAVGGKTVRDIEGLLTKLLLGDYLLRPQVLVEIKTFRSKAIYVLGEVRVPGKYTIEDQVTLLEVIAKAGSLTSSAGNMIVIQRYKEGLVPTAMPDPNSTNVAEIMRVSYEDLKEGRLQSNIFLQDGDILFVPEAERFYVTGFVKTPGTYVLKPNMTVQQAIAVAGGLTERGSTRRLKILRRVNGKEVEIKANMTDPVMANDLIKVSQRLI